MSRQDHPSHLAHMEFNLVTRVIRHLWNNHLLLIRYPGGEPPLVWAALSTASTLKIVIYNGGQPCVRKSWAAIGDRERA